MDSWAVFDITYSIAAIIALLSMRKSSAFFVYIVSCVIVPCMAALMVLSGIGSTGESTIIFFVLIGAGYAYAVMLAARKQLRPRLVYKIGAMAILAGVTGIQYGLYAAWLIDRVVFQDIYSSAMAALMLLVAWELRNDWTVENGRRCSNDYRADANSWRSRN